MKHFVHFLLLAYGASAEAQDLTLDSCIALAIRHERFADSRSLLADMKAVQNDEVNSAWYPQLALNAQSTIQNEQFGLPFSLPGVGKPEVPLDFHRVLVNFSQTVYDGQVTKARARLEQLNVDQQDLAFATREVELRGQITQRYMAVLLSETQDRLIDTKKNTIAEQLDRLRAAVDAGSALPSEADALEAEMLAIDQEKVQTRFTVERLRNELAMLSGSDATRTAAFAVPADTDGGDGTADNRPDIRGFDVRMQALDVQHDIARGTRLPKVKIFGNAGAGDPGYNSFNDNWRPMLLAGVGLEWRLLDWGSRKRTDHLLDAQKSLLQQDRDRLAEQWSIAIASQRKNITLYRDLATSDDRLIELRTHVSQAKAEQLANGVITASDYTIDLDKEYTARLAQEIHRLQAILAVRTSHDIQAR